jgi:PleD family two-component response regulator
MYFDGFSLKFTISVGAASKDANEIFEDTFKKADQNLYEAKGTGKNKVVYK